jgi:hypothetical protein
VILDALVGGTFAGVDDLDRYPTAVVALGHSRLHDTALKDATTAPAAPGACLPNGVGLLTGEQVIPGVWVDGGLRIEALSDLLFGNAHGVEVADDEVSGSHSSPRCLRALSSSSPTLFAA